MKTKMMAAVCVAIMAMTTPCVAMSVGAVPRDAAIESETESETESENDEAVIDWEQERDMAQALHERAQAVLYDNGDYTNGLHAPLADCLNLANDIEAFSHREAFNIIIAEHNYHFDGHGVYRILNDLRSNDSGKRIDALGYAIDYFAPISEFAGEHVQ